MQLLLMPLIGVGIIICVFLFFRVVVLWYWKIDKIIDVLIESNNKIVGMLTKIEQNTRPKNTEEKGSRPPQTKETENITPTTKN